MSLKEQFGKDVLLTGWGHSRFGKLTDETLESLIVQVATEAIGNAGIEPGQIDEIYLGQFNSGMMPLAFPSSLALQVSEQLANVPATRVENACASGSAAFQQGTKSLLAGTAKTVLVIGAEKMTHAGADVVGAALLGADYDMAGKASTTGFTGLFAEVAKHYEKRYGAGVGEWRRPGHHRGEEPPQRRGQPLRPAPQGPRRGVLPDRLGQEPDGGRSAAPHRLLARVRRRRRRRAVRLADRRGHCAGAARRLRPRERFLPRRAPRSHRVHRHPRLVAARAGHGRRRA